MKHQLTALAQRLRRLGEAPLVFSLFDLPYLFVTAGFLGTVYEVVLTLVKTGVWEDRTGSLFTPFNYVYGMGAVIILLCLHRLRHPVALYLAGGLLGGVVEFGLSLWQEKVLGSVSWDYSQRPLNIAGRTTVPYMLMWGLLCLLAIKLVFPLLLRGIHCLPPRLYRVGAVAIVCLMCVDVPLTLTATARYSQRALGVAAQNPLTQLLDRLFDDRFMAIHFPNMHLR